MTAKVCKSLKVKYGYPHRIHRSDKNQKRNVHCDTLEFKKKILSKKEEEELEKELSEYKNI